MDRGRRRIKGDRNFQTISSNTKVHTPIIAEGHPIGGLLWSSHSADEPQLPAVAACTHGEVEPDGAAGVALDEELVVILATFVANV